MAQHWHKMMFTAWILGGETLGIISESGMLTLTDYIQVGIDGFADIRGATLALPPITTAVEANLPILRKRNNAATVTGQRLQFVGEWREVRTVDNGVAFRHFGQAQQQARKTLQLRIIAWLKDWLAISSPIGTRVRRISEQYRMGQLTHAEMLTKVVATLKSSSIFTQADLNVFMQAEHTAWLDVQSELDRIAPRQYVITGVSRVKWLYYSNPLARFVHFVDPEQVTDPNYQHQMVMALDKQRREREERGLPIIDEQYLKVKKYPTGLWSAETAQSSIIPPVRRKTHGTRGLSRRRQRHPENRRQGRTG
ncbi:hypothetical protein [Lacticaseibacillus nasuensis]|uniref:hypothetical protein n=1 Tax=Lacticaseibacillus nasuensis TaxID=944671 RepID=UPI00224543D4|nr:hypothetical protein [Lacticaseibacillus nasuensis]MCX2456219.1 hypothetical protein [Lacticaseibacillus nasuensis]